MHHSRPVIRPGRRVRAPGIRNLPTMQPRDTAVAPASGQVSLLCRALGASRVNGAIEVGSNVVDSATVRRARRAATARRSPFCRPAARPAVVPPSIVRVLRYRRSTTLRHHRHHVARPHNVTIAANPDTDTDFVVEWGRRRRSRWRRGRHDGRERPRQTQHRAPYL